MIKNEQFFPQWDSNWTSAGNLQEEQLLSCTKHGGRGTQETPGRGTRQTFKCTRIQWLHVRGNISTRYSNKVSSLSKTHQKEVFLNEHISVIQSWQIDRLRCGQWQSEGTRQEAQTKEAKPRKNLRVPGPCRHKKLNKRTEIKKP